MSKFVRNTLLTSLLILSCLNSLAYANDASILDEPAKPVEAIEVIEAMASNEFPVNTWNTGFNFIVKDKTITVTHGKKIAFIKSNGVARQYYFNEKFTVSQNKVKLSNSQYNLIFNNIEDSNSRRIRIARAKPAAGVQSRNIYRNDNLSGYMTSVSVGTSLRVINSVLDGKMKVLTPDGREGYIDSFAVDISGDSIPPNVRPINFNTKYVILVSQNNQNMKIYMQDKSGRYNLARQSKVTTGRHSTPTPNGIFTIKNNRGTSFPINNSGGRAYNFVEFRGNYLFHSVLYSSANTLDQAAFRKLGSKDSAGCIRLPRNEAEWLYHNVSAGSIVIIDNIERDINKIVANKNV